jgi:gamma-glutamylcyclotransferase (GGCT)/AIG2-like uncharacterized protein YtfP
MTHIFVYGTLKHKESANSLLDDCEYTGPGRADCFVLMDLGGCPGLVPGRMGFGTSTAHGDIYSIPDDELPSLLEILDRLENNGRLYIRVKIPVIHIETGTSLECITYLFIPRFSLSQLVTSGNWSLKKED